MNKIYRWIWLQRNVGKFIAKLYREYTENGVEVKKKRKDDVLLLNLINNLMV